MYFKQFPLITYSFRIKGRDQLKVVRDIALNVRVRKDILQNVSLFDEYDIIEGDTPEIVSDKLYGSPLYHWTIMLVNEKYDYMSDYPLTDAALTDYVYKKYRTSEADEIVSVLYAQNVLNGSLHFVNDKGDVVDDDVPFAVPVTNFDYEFAVNEAKRRIRVINPNLINTVVNQLQAMFDPYNA